MAAPASHVRLRRDRLHWTITAGGRRHVLDLVPSPLGRSVRILVDGRRAGTMPKATARSPWHAQQLRVGDEDVTIALLWQSDVLATDVFIDGRSILDGRPLEVARAGAPNPLTLYEDVIRCLHWDVPPPDQPLVSRRVMPWLVALCVVWALAIVGAPYPPGPARVVALVVLLATTFAIWVIGQRAWLVALARVDRWLRARPQLGEIRRVAIYFGAMFGFAIGGLGAMLAAIYLFTAF